MIDKVLLLRYPIGTMIQDAYGIKEFQTKLPFIAQKIRTQGGHYLVTHRSKPSMVAIPFEDYQEIEDILMELNSPRLQKDVAKGRSDYKKGDTVSIDQLRIADER
ncbi:MAG: hypothetical protein Q8P72_00410 [Candidatus Roizmanbacteria bacterium]|uniref:Antitoxin n=1 Tax=Candidatus Roizmanbacteria bacterium CG_4_9_14_0_2_um_filter_39_13 TaxID=1974839 RepID=A0A2M8EYN7_9BACT|nr:hypothetical protein [Candidatus Roizmanbacteria bacterium]PIZ64079.1 MAG: hypothetical protein COY15_05895 [Candidatus Roizmanbacteria bacterium CG_4_10_14_0_2_um_filter_39_12]PJC31700.1 MAG: hypothetical protein CO051_03910 [Candidatus Roizmanbacteria bacterium CG_4_9_14_0_2_um_filter_39_13]